MTACSGVIPPVRRSATSIRAELGLSCCTSSPQATASTRSPVFRERDVVIELVGGGTRGDRDLLPCALHPFEQRPHLGKCHHMRQVFIAITRAPAFSGVAARHG